MLAIVIPYYKKTFFYQTLESLKYQTNQDFSVYIGNDNSPEDPLEIIEEFKNDFNITYVKFDQNLGGTSLVKQWERCLDLVNDEAWVTILGDDDTYSYNVVESFYNLIRADQGTHINVIRFSTYIIDVNDKVISALYKHPRKENAEEFLTRKYQGGTRSSLSEYFFRTRVVDRVGFKEYPLAWSSDTLAVVEFSKDGYIITINDAAVNFRISNQNISGQSDSIEKNEARFLFYSYLLHNYGKGFSIKLINMLFDRLEKTQLNNKKTPKRWLVLFCLYLRLRVYGRILRLPFKIKTSIK